MFVDSGAAVEGVSGGATVATVAHVVVAVVGKVVCSTVVADADRDLPGRRPVSM